MSAVVTLTLNPAIDQTVTLERLVPGAVHRATALRSDAGGKGVNVARCLADWGIPVAATGILGQDNAAPFEECLAQKGIDDRFVWIAGETRTNLKLLDLATSDTTDVNLPGLAVTPGTLDAVRAVLADMTGHDTLVVLAGSLPGSLPAETYARLTRDLRARGARVVLDASGPALAAALAAEPAALPHLIKPNRHELEEWAGRPLAGLPEIAEAARGLVRRGIPHVAVSMGADGALLAAQDAVLHARPPAMQVASTVGAGDALVAGLVAALYSGLDLPDTARLALAFAAGKLTKPGANLPPRPEIEAIAATIAVEEIRP
ncbi:1-phosphofructokinase [Methylobacterium oxalidis]|uniref:Phosphofructokinase n=1 Tax=Methylobacterium oxalidis TaxID=944322 RepID=A0A512J021_9HYPH|nr:1-phosphofructokinase [Methylobacterium oxalidis]GEP03312.1 phosphofructokinase [Methylobacterium oxalidis]GJE30407.1 Tagatose-6-phosphate kinase [Methylobacterium oxalidis]GLS64182.1 phosphofructokinase [Methylobacterium oxalidis]